MLTIFYYVSYFGLIAYAIFFFIMVFFEIKGNNPKPPNGGLPVSVKPVAQAAGLFMLTHSYNYDMIFPKKMEESRCSLH